MASFSLTKIAYSFFRDGTQVHTYEGSAEAMLAHLRSLQRRFPDSYWDVQRVSG